MYFATPVSKESYTVWDGVNSTGITASNFRAQTFKATSKYTITSIKLYMFRVGTPGTFTVSIKAIDGANKPTGAVLRSGTYDGNTLPTSADWIEVPMTTGGFVTTVETSYAIVLSSAGSTVGARTDEVAPVYADGYVGVSSDAGSTWTMYSTATIDFEIFGIWSS